MLVNNPDYQFTSKKIDEGGGKTGGNTGKGTGEDAKIPNKLIDSLYERTQDIRNEKLKK